MDNLYERINVLHYNFSARDGLERGEVLNNIFFPVRDTTIGYIDCVYAEMFNARHKEQA